MVVKINQEHLGKVLMKNWRIRISSSTLKINERLICNVSVAVGKIRNERHCMSMHKHHIRKCPERRRKMQKHDTSNVIYDRVKQYFVNLLTIPKRLTLLRIKLQKSWFSRLFFTMVI
jgi:hypothetical protein